MTDLYGATPLKGLWAAGECASTGVHGANRLASNSLMECIVYGRRAGRAMVRWNTFPLQGVGVISQIQPADLALVPQSKDLQSLLFLAGGPSRNDDDLRRALGTLVEWEEQIASGPPSHCQLALAKLILESALFRQESRGAHFRTDFSLSSIEFEARIVVQKGKPLRLLRGVS